MNSDTLICHRVTVTVDLSILSNPSAEINIEDVLNEMGYEFSASPEHYTAGIWVEASDMWDYEIKSEQEIPHRYK